MAIFPGEPESVISSSGPPFPYVLEEKLWVEHYKLWLRNYGHSHGHWWK